MTTPLAIPADALAGEDLGGSYSWQALRGARASRPARAAYSDPYRRLSRG